MLPGRPEYVAPERSGLWSDAHDLWLVTRVQAMREQGASATVRSDELIEQDEIAVLERAGAPVGVYAWRSFDVTIAANRNHRGLADFPARVVDQVAAEHRRILIAGHLCVAPSERGGKSGVALADVLVSVSILRLRRGPESAALVRTRNSRHMHALAYRHGGRKLGEVQAYGDASDVVIFDATATLSTDAHAAAIAEAL